MLIASFLIALLVSFANGAWLLQRLRTVHQSIWVDLGQPDLLQSNVGRPRVALLKYVWSLRFRELNDLALTTSCWAAIIVELILVALFAVFVFGAA